MMSGANFNAEKAIAKATGEDVVVRNDADVAGLAEMRFGAGKKARDETMIFDARHRDWQHHVRREQCVPNLELGHLYLPGHAEDAEQFTSDRTRTELDLSWEEWGAAA